MLNSNIQFLRIVKIFIYSALPLGPENWFVFSKKNHR